jgi:DNA-binding MarR family transcriptional regulator
MPFGPPETPPQTLLRSVEGFNRVLRESTQWLARDVGCSKATFAIVRILKRRGTLPVSDIAHALRVDMSVASRQVSQLVDDGIVERAVDDEDRRVRTIRLSPAGHALADQIAASVERRAHAVFAGWSADDLAAAAATLDRLTQTLGEYVEPAVMPTAATAATFA